MKGVLKGKGWEDDCIPLSPALSPKGERG